MPSPRYRGGRRKLTISTHSDSSCSEGGIERSDINTSNTVFEQASRQEVPVFAPLAKIGEAALRVLDIMTESELGSTVKIAVDVESDAAQELLEIGELRLVGWLTFSIRGMAE